MICRWAYPYNAVLSSILVVHRQAGRDANQRNLPATGKQLLLFYMHPVHTCSPVLRFTQSMPIWGLSLQMDPRRYEVVGVTAGL